MKKLIIVLCAVLFLCTGCSFNVSLGGADDDDFESLDFVKIKSEEKVTVDDILELMVSEKPTIDNLGFPRMKEAENKKKYISLSGNLTNVSKKDFELFNGSIAKIIINKKYEYDAEIVYFDPFDFGSGLDSDLIPLETRPFVIQCQIPANIETDIKNIMFKWVYLDSDDEFLSNGLSYTYKMK